jgi:hypothetical protein
MGGRQQLFSMQLAFSLHSGNAVARYSSREKPGAPGQIEFRRDTPSGYTFACLDDRGSSRRNGHHGSA